MVSYKTRIINYYDLIIGKTEFGTVLRKYLQGNLQRDWASTEEWFSSDLSKNNLVNPFKLDKWRSV
jgi:hypothetical protein